MNEDVAYVRNTESGSKVENRTTLKKKNSWHSIIFQMKVPLNSFHLNGYTAGFHPVKKASAVHGMRTEVSARVNRDAIPLLDQLSGHNTNELQQQKTDAINKLLQTRNYHSRTF